MRDIEKTKRDTLCPVPWMQQTVRENGMVSLCCSAGDDAILRDDGKPFHILDGSSVADIVNSRFVREVKQTMMAGEWHPLCSACKAEEQVGYSYRTLKRIQFDPNDFQRVVEQTTEDGTSPATFSGMHYILGNACNLKCRMCGPWSSSRWTKEAKLVWGESFPIDRFSGNETRWYESSKAWQDLWESLPNLRILHLTGGEPLVVPEMYAVLRHIIDAGEAHHIHLVYNTNLTKLPDELRALWTQFDGVELFCSIDGIGAVSDYIRNPSVWSEIAVNLKTLHDNFDDFGLSALQIACTVQVYNVLGIKDLIDFVIDHDLRRLDVNLSALQQPEYLSVRILPDEIRQLAIARLQEARRTCSEAKASKGFTIEPDIEQLIRNLERPQLENADYLLSEFRRVTTVLDRSRQESLGEVVPELAFLLCSDEMTTQQLIYPSQKTAQLSVESHEKISLENAVAVVKSYGEFLELRNSKGNSEALYSSNLPQPKSVIKQSIRVVIDSSKDPTEKEVLSAALVLLADFQDIET